MIVDIFQWFLLSTIIVLKNNALVSQINFDIQFRFYYFIFLKQYGCFRRSADDRIKSPIQNNEEFQMKNN